MRWLQNASSSGGHRFSRGPLWRAVLFRRGALGDAFFLAEAPHWPALTCPPIVSDSLVVAHALDNGAA